LSVDVAIIDYKMSNLHSVQAACNKVGLSSIITSKENEILSAKIAILPGVGAFGEAINQIKLLKLDEAIYKFIDTGKQFVGICLGFQLLFEKSEEFGNHSGLGIIQGEIKKFKPQQIDSTKYPVPQIGWNKIIKNDLYWEDTLLQDNDSDDFMYFIHSYYVLPFNKDIILSTTNYGDYEYCSSMNYKNIFASQFHPEKSGMTGLKVYTNLKNNIRNRINE
jgi:imidazole glycerol-phosphate synthase subunit HisH